MVITVFKLKIHVTDETETQNKSNLSAKFWNLPLSQPHSPICGVAIVHSSEIIYIEDDGNQLFSYH